MSVIPQLKKNQLVVSISMAAKLFWALTFILVKSMAQSDFSHFEFRFFLSSQHCSLVTLCTENPLSVFKLLCSSLIGLLLFLK